MNLGKLLYSIIILQSLREKAQSKIIKKWDDVEEFAGKVVAFTTVTDEPTYLSAPAYYHVTTDKTIFASISKISLEYHKTYAVEDANAYSGDILIKKEAVPSRTAFLNAEIEKAGGIDMRLATFDELNTILDAVRSGDAEFCYQGQVGSEKTIIGVFIDELNTILDALTPWDAKFSYQNQEGSEMTIIGALDGYEE